MARFQVDSNKAVVAGLIAYALLCLVVFTWLRFPYDALRPRMEKAIASSSGINIVLGHIRPSLTGGFVVDGVKVKDAVVIRRLGISPYPWEALMGVWGVGFSADLPSGFMKGKARIPFRKGHRPLEIDLEVKDMNLDGVAGAFPPASRPSGVVNAQIRLAAPGGAFEKSVGAVTISWRKGSLPVNLPSLPFNSLVFETLDLEGNVEGGMLNLQRGEFTGEFSGTFTGIVRLGRDLGQSRLNLTGELTLPEGVRAALGPAAPSPGQPAKFTLRGNLAKPRFRLIGAGMRRPANGTDISARRSALLERRQRSVREGLEGVGSAREPAMPTDSTQEDQGRILQGEEPGGEQDMGEE